MAPPFSIVFAFSLLFIGVFVNAQGKAEEAVAFGYGGSDGPQNWGRLCPQYATCSNGKFQSPIDIVKGKAVFEKNLQTLIRTYSFANATLVNNGFNVGVHFEGDVGGVVIDGKNYSLKQMHWHSPSEHLIDGERFAAELHLVHKADDDSVTVIAILLQYGDPDPLIAKFHGKLVELTKDVREGNKAAHVSLGMLDVRHLREKTRKYFRYIGSFTTPPCSEKVIWNILGKVRTISKEQVEALKAPLSISYKNNDRPPQSLNGRQIQLYDEFEL